MGVRHNTTTAFHPHSNGMVERFHKQLNNSLCSRWASSSWFQHLPWVLSGLHSVPREDSTTSSVEAVYGSDLVLPNQFQTPQDPPNQFYKDLRTQCLDFVQFQLVTILQLLLNSPSRFQILCYLVTWFLLVRMVTFLL